VRRKPYSVILFDEIEKAHPDVFNVMLQILDDGRLTDGQGHTVDFTNALVIMTSNLGGAVIHDTLAGRPDLQRGDAAYEAMEQRVLEILRAHFRPEFLNRIDEVIIFHSLAPEHIKQIVRIQMARLLRHLEDKRITLELTDEAADRLAAEGFDPAFGARPLKRVLQRKILDAMATRLLNGEINEGDHLKVEPDPARPDEMRFTATGKSGTVE
jgi:ATP-dependent Clp protease ATP-binding subunit ClpB